MGNFGDETMTFRPGKDDKVEARKVIQEVYEALKAKGYNPINQMVGYLLSGDPAYVTSFNNARNLIRRVERNELLEEILRAYLEGLSR